MLNLIICFLIGFIVARGIRTFIRRVKVDFALKTAEELEMLVTMGIITPIQGSVFLNDMQDPYDSRAIFQVKRELDEIVKEKMEKVKRGAAKKTD